MLFCTGTLMSMWLVCVHSSSTHSLLLIERVETKRAHCSAPAIAHIGTPPFPAKRLIHQSAPSAAPLCEAGGTGAARACARISQSSSATVPSRWPTVIWWSDFMCSSVEPPPLRPTVPTIGQGSYNRRFGGRGPPGTAPQLSRCGEGVGRGGLSSPTVEKRPNEVPRDGPMNHYQLC